MSCNSCNNGTFSSENDTWTKRSDLLPSSWDPYPELMGNNYNQENYSDGCYFDKKNAYTNQGLTCKENFACTSCNYTSRKNAYDTPGLSPYVQPAVENYTGVSGCAMYAQKGMNNCGTTNVGPIHAQMAQVIAPSRENYQEMSGCCTQDYEKLGQTWTEQKRYSLG